MVNVVLASELAWLSVVLMVIYFTPTALREQIVMVMRLRGIWSPWRIGFIALAATTIFALYAAAWWVLVSWLL